MQKYILFEYDGIVCVAKKTPFTQEERMNGFHYYDLVHGDDDYFPSSITKNALFNYWGSIMTTVPIRGVEKYGYEDLYELDVDEFGNEVMVPGDGFVTNVQFLDLKFYIEASESSILGKSTDFSSILSVWECIDPYFYKATELSMNRTWAMPSKNTFAIKPIADLLRNEIKGGFVIDPFANENKFGHITNDLNEKYDTNYHMDALEFLKMFPVESVDIVLFDPPYSARQIKEAYESVGMDTQGGELTRASYWSAMKKEIARILRVGGKAISFGWNSGGMNNKDIFNINRIQLVPHGGNHNDTIVTVSVKVKSYCTEVA